MLGGIQMVIDRHHLARVRWDLRGLVGRIWKVMHDVSSSSGVIWMKFRMGWRGGVPNRGVLDCVCIWSRECKLHLGEDLGALSQKSWGMRSSMRSSVHVIRLLTICVLTWCHALAEGGGICTPYMLHFPSWHICWVAKKHGKNTIKICYFLLYFSAFRRTFSVFFCDPTYVPAWKIKHADVGGGGEALPPPLCPPYGPPPGHFWTPTGQACMHMISVPEMWVLK
jgi:hypothetical protein